ncbi:vacuolar protein 14 C-terminal Fig4p binding-domain-containing protein [Cunninghamella echinulata]|nr:vacuolar protein 14 C-terminal Fig4p binding-domain-containing protein [Cunninghamella echinulata]
METSIFAQPLIRGLTDKIYDRRKAAALEIEKLVRENENTPERITEIIDALVQDFVYSNNSNARYGGLIGLAATAIALGPSVDRYLDIIVPPILSCFSNQDQKVRYYACESMYNIAKVAKGEVLRFFNSIFDALCKLSADSEVTVKGGAELLDRLIKDIVSELSTTYVSPFQQPLNSQEGDDKELPTPSSLPRNTAFSLPRFIPLLSQRIYVRNSNARQYLVSWIGTLDSIPDLELVSFLPEFLDGLIQCLNDPSNDVRTSTRALLDDFLHEIRQAAQAAEIEEVNKNLNDLSLTHTTAELIPSTVNTSPDNDTISPLDVITTTSSALPSSTTNTNINLPVTNSSSATISPEVITATVVDQKASTVNDKDPNQEFNEHNNDNNDTNINVQNEKVVESELTEASNTTIIYNENDGQGKGTYIPGQGIVVQYARIVEILVPHLSSPDEDIQRTALEWINEFTIIAKKVIIQFTPEIIKAVLPSLAHPVPIIHEIAIATNQSLQKLVLEAPLTSTTSTTHSTHLKNGYDDHISIHDENIQQQQQQYRIQSSTPTTFPSSEDEERGTRVNVDHEANHLPEPFDYQATLANLRLQFLNEHEETRVASLEWLLMLHKKAPNKILVSDDGTFPALLKTLSDSSEEVVRRDLQLLAQISSYSDHEYFRHFMTNLLLLFSTDRKLLETRGSLIIRQLCLSLDPERIYITIADILEMDEDLEFASIMVQNLNIILITASELSDLRKRLRNLDHKDGQRLFIALYKSWCHNAVATFSLCLLAQVYEHAANMLQVFAELEITVNMLIQIDKLVQLLESPVFTYLRLQLLEPEKYPYLFKCLYGILMLLPQSSAFSTLRNRLNSVSSLGFLNVMPKRIIIKTTNCENYSKRNVKK